MFNLVLKDLLIQKKSSKDFIIEFIVDFTFILILQFFGASCIYIITPVIFTISFITKSCGFGEKNDVDRMIGSLPVSRKEVVFSKYVSAFIFFICGVAITALFCGIIKLFGFSNISRFMNLQDIMIACIFTIIYSCLYLPICLWIGYSKSQQINNILFFSMFIGLVFAVILVDVIDNGTANYYIMNFISLPNFKLYTFISFICFSSVLIFTSISASLKFYLNRDF